MQWAEEEVEAEKLLPKRKVKHHDVAIMRASKAAPDAASLPARRPRQQQEPADGGGGGWAEMDADIGGGDPGLDMTACNVATGQETASRTQMARNEAVEGAWAPLRVELVDGALVEMKEHAALQVLLRYKELEGFKQWLQEMIQSMKCPTCGHRDLEEKDPVLVSLLTLTAVHRLEMPVFVCLRRVSTKCPAIAEILVQLLDFDLHFLGDPLLSAGVWLFRRRGPPFPSSQRRSIASLLPLRG